jgi:hypothetical protein
MRSIGKAATEGGLASWSNAALRGLHQSFAGTTFGPYDTVFAVGGLLFIIGGLAAIPLLAGAPAGQTAQGADTEPTAVTPDSGIADATAD